MKSADGLVKRTEDLIAKGDAVLATHKPNPSNVIGFATLDTDAFTEWQTQSLTFLTSTLRSDHVYVATFRDKVEDGFRSHVQAGIGVPPARQDGSVGRSGGTRLHGTTTTRKSRSHFRRTRKCSRSRTRWRSPRRSRRGCGRG